MDTLSPLSPDEARAKLAELEKVDNYPDKRVVEDLARRGWKPSHESYELNYQATKRNLARKAEEDSLETVRVPFRDAYYLVEAFSMMGAGSFGIVNGAKGWADMTMRDWAWFSAFSHLEEAYGRVCYTRPPGAAWVILDETGDEVMEEGELLDGFIYSEFRRFDLREWVTQTDVILQWPDPEHGENVRRELSDFRALLVGLLTRGVVPEEYRNPHVVE